MYFISGVGCHVIMVFSSPPETRWISGWSRVCFEVVGSHTLNFQSCNTGTVRSALSSLPFCTGTSTGYPPTHPYSLNLRATARPNHANSDQFQAAASLMFISFLHERSSKGEMVSPGLCGVLRTDRVYVAEG